jgi:hypothetical protein
VEENQNPIQNPVVESQPVSEIPSTTPVNPKPKFSLSAIIGIIIFLLLAGGAAAGYVYREPLMKLVINPTPTPTISISPTPSPDPTADWQTFTNTPYGYSIKYPKDFVAQPPIPSNGRDIDIILPKKKGLTHVFISLTDNTNNLTAGAWLNEQQGLHTPGVEVVINGIPGVKTTIAGATGTNIDYLLSKNKWIYDLELDSLGDPNGIITLEQILSTFKFADSTTVDTSNWKTYSYKGVSFMYPSNWGVHLNGNVAGKPDDFSLQVWADNSQGYQPDEFLLGNYKDSLTTYAKTEENEFILNEKGDEYLQVQINNNSIYVGCGFYSNKQKTIDICNQILKTTKLTGVKASPTPTCMPRPACLDSEPRCMIPEPANGWCP